MAPLPKSDVRGTTGDVMGSVSMLAILQVVIPSPIKTHNQKSAGRMKLLA